MVPVFEVKRGDSVLTKRSTMSVRWKIILAIWVIAALLAVGAMVGTAAAQKDNPTPPPSQKMSAVSAREAAAKQLLLLMDTNKDGKVSKQEWMSFMEKEFDRLDTDKDGYVDANDLEKSQLRLVPLSKVGK
jgi:uncharacterized membrane protein YdfJ with MMPL/SSD domain